MKKHTLIGFPLSTSLAVFPLVILLSPAQVLTPSTGITLFSLEDCSPVFAALADLVRA